MSEHTELDSRVKELEALVKRQASQIEGLKQSVDILIGMIAANLDHEEEEHNFPMGPQMPAGPDGLNFNT